MIAALNLLKDTPAKRHIAVLGTMKELGNQSASLHRQVGETVAQLNLDYLLVLVDEPETEAMAQGAQPVTRECFRDKNELVERLKTLIQPEDCLLFKASHSVGLDQILNQLLPLFQH